MFVVMIVTVTSAVAVSKKSETRVRPTVTTGRMLTVAAPARAIAATHVKMLEMMMLAVMMPRMVQK